MTYKAGDKVVYEGKIHTIEIPVLQGCYINGVEQKVYNFNLSPATPVEIAKQAVLDEVSNRMDSASPILNELLDVLISKAEIQGFEHQMKIISGIANHISGTTTPPIIGDETKLD
jgi:hypothetical protein